MNRKLLVSLLRKSIEELEMITDGFMEMDEYPKVILQLAKRKTEDIQSIIEQLQEIKIPVVNIAPSADEKATTVLKEDIQPAPQTDSVPEPHPIPEPEHVPVSEPEPVPVTEPEIIIETQAETEKTETPEIIELEETIELLNEIEFSDLVTDEEDGMKVIELDDLEDVLKIEKTEEPIIIKIPDPDPEPLIKQIKKESRVEELLIKTTSEETKVVTLADKIAPSKISRSEKLSQADNSLSASIANKKIDDIKQAISIGDRFRFQRELFNGNGEDMNKTLNYINQLASLEEVLSFLQNKYKWVEEDNDVVDFMQIVKRRFS